MKDAHDDFIDALNFQVKEEIIRNYFRERLILEEEIKEYHEVFEEYRLWEYESREFRDQLICLLMGQNNFAEFFRWLGFYAPPLQRLGVSDGAEAPPACPLGLTPRGLTKKGQYIDLVLKTYGLFFEKAVQGRKAAARLLALAHEINTDISKFHLNFDLLSIINFLKTMNSDLQQKKRILGSNFGATELSALEESMMFKKLKPANQGIRSWPELPAPQVVRQRTSEFLGRIFQQGRAAILPALKKNK